jgi:hypothetical protein
MESYFVYTNFLSPSPCNYSSAHAGDINVGGGRTNRARSRTLRRTSMRVLCFVDESCKKSFEKLNNIVQYK